jgi:hypothetical protein
MHYSIDQDIVLINPNVATYKEDCSRRFADVN